MPASLLLASPAGEGGSADPDGLGPRVRSARADDTWSRSGRARRASPRLLARRHSERRL